MVTISQQDMQGKEIWNFVPSLRICCQEGRWFSASMRGTQKEKENQMITNTKTTRSSEGKVQYLPLHSVTTLHVRAQNQSFSFSFQILYKAFLNWRKCICATFAWHNTKHKKICIFFQDNGHFRIHFHNLQTPTDKYFPCSSASAGILAQASLGILTLHNATKN